MEHEHHLSLGRDALAEPRCYLCGSRDTMPPFNKREALPLLSLLVPIRWRYCRRGAHHFLDFRKPRRRS